MSKTCLVLVSSSPSTLAIEQNQRRMLDALIGHKIEYSELDGADQANIEMRNKLFGISGKRAVYPQCFFVSPGGDMEFVADWDALESLMECESIPADVLASNPAIQTFAKVFADCKTV